MLFMSRVQSNNFYSTCNTPANLSDTPDKINIAIATPNTHTHTTVLMLALHTSRHWNYWSKVGKVVFSFSSKNEASPYDWLYVYWPLALRMSSYGQIAATGYSINPLTHAFTHIMPDPSLSPPTHHHLCLTHQSMPGLISANKSNKPKCRPQHLITGIGMLEESALCQHTYWPLYRQAYCTNCSLCDYII